MADQVNEIVLDFTEVLYGKPGAAAGAAKNNYNTKQN